MARNHLINVEYLRDETNGTWKDLAMTTATGTYTSSAIKVWDSTGHAALIVDTSAGSLAITFQVSTDGNNWYTPIDTSETALNSIVTALSSSDNGWIVFNPQLCTYIRFVFVLTGSNSTVSARYLRQVE